MKQFDTTSIAFLQEPLDKTNIKQRKGAKGRQLDYVTGGYVIATANRIFGFDGWNCQTIEMKLVKENPISYVARVRVTVGDVVREGFGGAEGRDHENTVKSAETDALKRALKSFGNQFGLPLYDQEDNQNNIIDSSSKPAYKRPPVPQASYEDYSQRIDMLQKDANFVQVEVKIRECPDFSGTQITQLIAQLNARKNALGLSK